MNLEYAGTPKMLRETLCEAQALLVQWMPRNYDVHMARLQALINEVDKHRPLGPDGVHGDRHTATCGCEDKGHGSWCDHRDCHGCDLAEVLKCFLCGHDYRKAPIPRI